MSVRRLLVIVPDRVSEIVAKGEYTPRYYNPGDLFEEVHLLLTNDDRPDRRSLQATAGSARLVLHNLPLPPAGRTLGRLPALLGRWASAGVSLAREIDPLLIRAHGNYYNGFLAAAIKERLQVPLVVSLHTNPDVTLRAMTPWWPAPKERLGYELLLLHEKRTLRAADWVLPVYEPIREYARRRGARRIRVCYNMLSLGNVTPKESYALGRPPRIISVGRQLRGKNPASLVRALAGLEGHLTLVGDGPCHGELESLVGELGLADRVRFHRSLPNEELCRRLPDFDIFAAHTDYWEIPKALLEPLLAGLPVVVNRRRGRPVPELQGDWVRLVEDTPGGYLEALRDLIEDHAAREGLGRRAARHAWRKYAPEKTEEAFVEIYRTILEQGDRAR